MKLILFVCSLVLIAGQSLADSSRIEGAPGGPKLAISGVCNIRVITV